VCHATMHVWNVYIGERDTHTPKSFKRKVACSCSQKSRSLSVILLPHGMYACVHTYMGEFGDGGDHACIMVAVDGGYWTVTNNSPS